ncbi:UNVERIFIED_CONTAM: hypothetical protein HDU68_000255 [Siphonaria sp. JEL0065]|nr:hypothetical protein HDU68_000255 [Siphonaria sp. JEL0065]
MPGTTHTMLTPEQKSLVKDIASEVPSMVSTLSKRISVDEFKNLIDWANETVIVEFLEASAWDRSSSSRRYSGEFEVLAASYWTCADPFCRSEEYGVLEAQKTVVPNLVPGLETTYAC